MNDGIRQVNLFEQRRTIAVVRKVTKERHRCNKDSASEGDFRHFFLYFSAVMSFVVIDTKATNLKPFNHTCHLLFCKLPYYRHLHNPRTYHREEQN